MYKQENKAGVKSFLITVAMAFGAIVISEFLGGLLGFLSGGKIPARLSGHIMLAAMCVLIVFWVYNYYASVYKYKINSEHIVIEKKTGSRVTEYDIPIDEIKNVYIKKTPKLKGKKLRLCSSIFSRKNTSVIVCGNEKNIIVFEPDEKFVKKIKEYMND